MKGYITLDGEISAIYLIYSKVKESREIFKYLHNKIRNNDSFWGHIAYLTKKDIIIDLDKLLSKKSQDHNLHSFLERFKKHGNFKALHFDRVKLDSFEKELKNFSGFESSINNLRNKIFAHTDRVTEEEINHLDILDKKFDDLFMFIEDVLQTTSLLQGVQLDFRGLFRSDEYSLHEMLEKASSDRLSEFIAEANSIKRR